MADLERIRSIIYEIRGARVMLDSDLAELYQVDTKQLKRAVRRNIERFEGDDFMFELTMDEYLRCKNGTSSHGGVRYAPFAFTELGVAMLSSVLRSSTAIEVNRRIMRAFVAVRQMFTGTSSGRLFALEQRVGKLEQYIEEVIRDVNDVNEDTRAQIEIINETIAEMRVERRLQDTPRPLIGFKP